MKRHKKIMKCIMTVLLTAILLCAGCGKNAEESIPELIEPAAANASYRPVELGTIGETQVLYGTVVPMEYCCFFDSYASIEKITVEVGDYVEEGDIVAYADVEVAKEQLEELNGQLENENQNYEMNHKIARVRIDKLEKWELPTVIIESVDGEEAGNGAESGNGTGAGEGEKNNNAQFMSEEESEKAEEKLEQDKATGLEKEQENLRYDKLLHEYRVSKIQEKMESQQEIITEGTLKAPHSGYVTYVKNLGAGTDVSAGENIVVISNPQETYIELTNKTIDKYTYEDYEVKYLFHAGKRYDVTEMEYSMDTEVLAKALKRYPNVRLNCPAGSELKVGEMYPVFYSEKKLEEIPIIGLDSLNGEKDDYFVYVKGENGEREKRSVTIGESDRYYAQVLSGLELGEAVYYESETSMPTEYGEYKVELSDYTIENLSNNYQLADEQVLWYDVQSKGMITEIAVKKGDEVEKGDLLFVMESEDGKAAIAAAKNNINRENTTYEESIKRFADSLSSETDENNREILKLQSELETINHNYRLKRLEKTYSDMTKNNDGNGKISVYAKQSGTISAIEAEEGASLAEGSHVLSVSNEATDKLLVQMEPQEYERVYENNIAEVGEKITITVEDKTYQGKCTGITVHQKNNLAKSYVTEKEGTTTISYFTESGYSYPAFYVEMEDETFYEDMPVGKVTFSYVAMEDVIVVPTAVVQEEARAKDPSKKDYFVWRIEGDELVKQFVLIDEEFSDVSKTVILSGVHADDVLVRVK